MSQLNLPPSHASAQSPSSSVPHDPAQPSIQHSGDSVTTGTLPVVSASTGPAPRQRPVREPVGLWLGVLGVISVLGGAVGGTVWKWLVPLTEYVVTPDSGAETTERGLAMMIAADAWFTALGMVFGILLGVLAWRWFGGLGWPVVLIAVLSAVVMGLATWQMGWWLGPRDFSGRLGTATPGQLLPVDLTVRAPAALLAWPFGAVLPVMFCASLLRDPEVGRAGRVPVR